MALDDSEVFLTPKQLAEDIHTSEQQLYHWRQTKRGPPFIRRAGRIYYSETAVRDWWKNGEPPNGHAA
jgi:hypothetical protein